MSEKSSSAKFQPELLQRILEFCLKCGGLTEVEPADFGVERGVFIHHIRLLCQDGFINATTPVQVGFGKDENGQAATQAYTREEMNRQPIKLGSLSLRGYEFLRNICR